MTYLLLLLTIATAVTTAFVLARLTDKLVALLIGRLVDDKELCTAWTKYIRLAIYVVGVTGGVKVYQLERYLSGSYELDPEIGRIGIEIFRAASDAAVAVIWLLLPVFLVSLIIGEVRKVVGARKAETTEEEKKEGELPQ
jgi:hypothetical protein